MSSQFSLSNDPWDLHRRADRDRSRHNEKIKDAVKKNLADIISQQDIITGDKNKIIKVPMRGLELPHIRFDPNDKTRVGSGKGGTKKGDILGRAPGDEEEGAGKQAGTEPGIDTYDAEFSMAEIAALVFEDLHLPNMEDKGSKQVENKSIIFNSITKRGLMGNLDRIRTVKEAIRRKTREGSTGKLTITDEDKRFKNYEEITEPQRNAVIFAMRDISGSMGEHEAYIARSFYFWMKQFLQTKYNNAEIVFITCHTEAKEVDEHNFFHAGETGGTRMSSAYSLAMDIIAKRYNPREWNIYPFLFSDGYNWGDQECVDLVRKMLDISNLVGYGEIAGGWGWDDGGEFAPLGKAYETAFKDEPRMVNVKINNREDVWPALQKFFSNRHPDLPKR